MGLTTLQAACSLSIAIPRGTLYLMTWAYKQEACTKNDLMSMTRHIHQMKHAIWHRRCQNADSASLAAFVRAQERCCMQATFLAVPSCSYHVDAKHEDSYGKRLLIPRLPLQWCNDTFA